MDTKHLEGQPPRVAALRCGLHSQEHGGRRQLQRGISREEIREAIFRGTLRRRRDRWEAQFRYLKVVFRMRPCNIYLITVYYRG